MISCVHLDDRGNDLRCFFQFNYKLTPTTLGLATCTWPMPMRQSEEAIVSEGGDASQDQRPLRLQELEERVCHHGEAEPPQHCLLTRGRLCHLRLLMPGRRLRPLEAISATQLEVRGSSASICRRRGAGGSSTVIIISMTTMAMVRSH